MYFFNLGHNPKLSIAEILSVLEKDKIKAEIIEQSSEILLLNTDKGLDVELLMCELGGTVKIGVCYSNVDSNKFELDANALTGLLPTESGKKVFFGISVYDLQDNSFGLDKIIARSKQLAMEVKKGLSDKGVSSRWVTSKDRILSSVIVQKNKLLTQGAEIVLLVKKDKIYIGKTSAVQEFEEYGLRDYGRPRRDILSGMMPPKLAKIMINLAQAPKDAVILDPFCGVGTVLQEALLLGYNVIGADESKQAVENAKENLTWLMRNKNLEIQEHKNKRTQELKNLKIFQSDVRKLSERLEKNSVDAIVTEPYLGPIKIKDFEVEQVVQELSQLYIQAFKEFKKVLKKDGKVVIIFPAFDHKNTKTQKHKNTILFLPILDKVRALGFKIVSPLPEEIKKNSVVEVTQRNSLIYSRPGQRVLREVFRFTIL